MLESSNRYLFFSFGRETAAISTHFPLVYLESPTTGKPQPAEFTRMQRYDHGVSTGIARGKIGKGGRLSLFRKPNKSNESLP
jgi:hypothetical protein